VKAGRRIVVFVPAIHAFGGVERLLVDLSRFLYGERRPHTILCLNRSIDLAGHADWPIDVRALEPARNPVAEGWALARYFRDPDNVGVQAPLFFDLKGAFYAGLFRCPGFHLHLTDPPSLLPRDASKRALSVRNRFPRAQADDHGWHAALRGEAVHWVNKRGVRRARSVIAMTRTIADEIESLYSISASVVRPGIEFPPQGRRSPPRKPDTIRFLSVSRLEASKRIDWILRALAELEHAQDPLSAQSEWALDVVGDGSEAAALRELAGPLGIANRVEFHGRVSDEQLEILFAQADVFLMPALQGYGLPALESLARGTPVILHRDSGVSEFLNKPPWIETIAQGPQDLGTAIRRMVTNIASGVLQRQSRPEVPTASDWAQKIAVACGWS
jgi:glycosyltransferase involved in cell wall biosynthesis